MVSCGAQAQPEPQRIAYRHYPTAGVPFQYRSTGLQATATHPPARGPLRPVQASTNAARAWSRSRSSDGLVRPLDASADGRAAAAA